MIKQGKTTAEYVYKVQSLDKIDIGWLHCVCIYRCVLHHYTGMPRCPDDLSPVRVYIYTGIPPKNYSFLHNYIKIHARYHQTMTIHSQSFNLFECNCKVFTYLILFIIMSLMIKINPNSQDESALILFCVLLCKVHITHCRAWFR